MEEVFLRFPHSGEGIFNALDNKTFAFVKKWAKFVQERRVRIIKKMIEKLKPDYQQSLEVAQANISLTHYPDDSFR